MRRLSLGKIGVSLLVADFVLLLLAGMAGFAGLVQTTIAGSGALDRAPLQVMPILTVWTFYKRDLYNRRTILQPVAWRQIVLGWFHASGLLLLAAVTWSVVASRSGSHRVGIDAAAGLGWSRALAFMVTGLAGSFAICLLWSVLRLRLVGWGWVPVHTRAVVAWTRPEVEQIVSKLRNDPGAGLEVVGVLDDGLRHRGERASVRGVTVLGSLRDMVRVVRRSDVDTVIVALPWTEGARIDVALVEAERLPVEARLAPDAVLRTYLHRPASSVADQPLFEIGAPPISWRKLAVKRVEDLVLALVLLLVLSPVMLAIASAIGVNSRGPVIFKQRRCGFNGRISDVYKFRSMHARAFDEAWVRQTSRGDPRLTRVGALLRRHSLDELPQPLNVLRSEMSMVGPAPHALSTRTEDLLLEDAADFYVARSRVKPGIIGWDQVNGWRVELDTCEKPRRRVELDLAYADCWSLFLDLHILWRTLRCVVCDSYAY